MANYLATDTDLTAVANAIRTKGGTSAQMAFPNGFVSAVNAIPTGETPIEENDVNFYDWDGTLLYSYTASDFLALSEMPANPVYTDMTAQGWNYTLSDAKEYVTSYGILDIGQMAITSDGKTRIIIDLDDPDYLSPMLGICVNGSIDIDWGDGSEHSSLTGTSITTTKWTDQHQYSTVGEYVITISVTGSIGFSGADYTYLIRHALSSSNRANYCYLSSVKEIRIGENVDNFGNYSFASLQQLKKINLPNNNSTTYNGSLFRNCYSLNYVTIPKSAATVGSQVFNNCTSLHAISIPKELVDIGQGFLNAANSISRLCIPNGVTSLAGNFAASCRRLISVVIPNSVTTIGGEAFSWCVSLLKFVIPENVTSIGGLVLNYAYVYKYVVYPDEPPTITTTSLAVTTGVKILVPYSQDHSILNAYKTATNWSAFADYMEEMAA